MASGRDIRRVVSETVARNVSIEPLINKLNTNPEPSDWALLVSYYRLVHHSFEMIKSNYARISIVKMIERFKDEVNRRLGNVASVVIYEGVPYLLYKGEKIELGFTDVWTLMAVKPDEESVRKAVEKIYKTHKGEVYNTKYYPLGGGALAGE